MRVSPRRHGASLPNWNKVGSTPTTRSNICSRLGMRTLRYEREQVGSTPTGSTNDDHGGPGGEALDCKPSSGQFDSGAVVHMGT